MKILFSPLFFLRFVYSCPFLNLSIDQSVRVVVHKQPFLMKLTSFPGRKREDPGNEAMMRPHLFDVTGGKVFHPNASKLVKNVRLGSENGTLSNV